MSTYEINSYEDIKDKLRVRLTDIKENKEKLADLLYKTVGCGLALSVYIEVQGQDDEIGIADLPAAIATKFEGVDLAGVFEDALKSSVSSEPPTLCAIQDILFGSIAGYEPADFLKGGPAPEDGMFVLSTTDRNLGAAALFYPGIKEKIGDLFGRDYFVLPSSVHEVLILPDNGVMAPSELALMVKEINANEVGPQDRLCNRVFRFRTETQELTVAADPDRKREMVR
ncbi:MAG: hypothetical protein IJJ48_07380 [Firmicutes bacterium]|nr:hypothetical protein [Bacillota bacterium]